MKILLVDHHEMFREGIALLLAPLQPDVETIFAGSCEEGFATLQSDPEVDLVLLDLSLPDMSGLDAIAVLHERFAGIPIVVLSSTDDQQTVLRAIDRGAMGFISKKDSSETLIAALRLILAKCIYLPPSAFLGEQYARRDAPMPREPSEPAKSRVTPSDLGFTPRQAEVLHLLIQGKSSRQISRILKLSEGTVRSHISSVLRTLNPKDEIADPCAFTLPAHCKPTVIDNYPQRHHPFEGCFNFRDIGGYPTADGRTVRWGRYFRAGRQDRMTAQDLEKLRALGIRTQIDLRRPDEVEEQGRGPMESLGAEYHDIAVIPLGGSDELNRLVGDTNISGRRYLGYLGFGPEPWLRMFELFAAAERHPLLVHCTAGKDRTGVSTAFLLSVLGVERHLIEADYVLSNRDVARQVAFIESTTGLPDGMDRTVLLRLAGIPESAMGEFLDGLEERWGGAVGYLRSIGIDDATLDAVRDAFLEP